MIVFNIRNLLLSGFSLCLFGTTAYSAPILYYNFEQSGSSEDQVGSANVTWGATGASANADSPLGDTLGSSFGSTSVTSTATQASTPIIGLSDFSISFWMNLSSAESGGSANGVLDMLSGSTGGGMQVLISPGDNIALGVGGASFQNRLSTVALGAGNFGAWIHVAITVDRDNASGITYYVNGVQLGGNQNPTAYVGTSIAANQNLQVGSTNALPFNGLLDDLAIYTDVLSAAQVASLANGTKTPLTVSGPPGVPPSAPTGLVAISSNHKVDLSWTPNSEVNVNQYWIYRKEGQGSFRRIGISTEAQYTDYAFSSSVQYAYHVIARNSSNQGSPASSEVLGSFTPPTSIDLSASSDRPHIILVMADDQGWGDTGYNGHPFVQTPATDAMAAAGFVLNRFYAAAPVCSPTRASVLTGRHPIRCKVPQHGRYMRAQEVTIAEALKEAGYVTGIFGKVHLGSGQPNSPANPTAMGFDEWFIGLNFFDNNPYLSRNGIVEHPTGKGSDITIDETIAFIGRHKDGSKPIFAVAWFPSPHDPHAEVPDGPTLYSGQAQAGYYREITLLDEGLGRLRQYLRDQDIHENTILWYCSDNGGLNSATSGGRGKKTDIYEGGLRVPGIIEWPTRGLTGATNVPISTMDMYPTLLAMAGANVNDPLPLDGEDVSDILEGNSGSHQPIGFWHNFQGGQSTFSNAILQAIMVKQQNGDPTPHDAPRIKKDIDEFPQFSETASPGHAAWLSWPWKLHRINGSVYELYHLDNDPMETTNLSGSPEHAQRLSDMQAELLAWQQSVVKSINGADYGQLDMWLPLNRAQGIEAFDANGAKRGDLVNVLDNTSHWVAGKHNRALELDGVDDQLDIANSNFYPPVGANARSVSAWIKTSGSGMICKWGDSAISGGAWEISIDTNGRLHLSVSAGSLTGQTDLRDNAWHHIAVVLPNDGSPNVTEAILYVDGTAETISASIPRAVRTSNSKVCLGGVRVSSAHLAIDEFRIIPRAMTPADVASEFNATKQAAAAWLLRNFGSVASVDWASDSDNDGLDLLAEYALGTNPLVSDRDPNLFNPIYNTVTKKLEVMYPQRIDGTHDLNYGIQMSRDLIDWSLPWTVKSSTNHPFLDTGLFELRTVESNESMATESRLFMRLNITN